MLSETKHRKTIPSLYVEGTKIDLIEVENKIVVTTAWEGVGEVGAERMFKGYRSAL